MKTVLVRLALVVGMVFNVVLLVVHLFMLYVLVTQTPDVIAFSSDTAVSVHLLGAVYFAPLAISFGLWWAGRSKGLTGLARANVFTMAAFYAVVLACVVTCRIYDIWIDVS